MPIFRYFVFVGGALLALLFAADYGLPSQPMAQTVAAVPNEQPLIRIRSDRHLPDRVVLDTAQPAVAPAAVAVAAVAAPQPPVRNASTALDETSTKSGVRETFAQFTPDANAETAGKGAAQASAQGQAHAQAKTKRKVARIHPMPQQGRPMMVAQQPHFGLFDTTW